MKASSMRNMSFRDESPLSLDLRREVVEGLTRRPKKLPPKLFYDARGSQLFDAICRLPEYYLSRTEMLIIEENATELAGLIGRDATLIEPGSGSSLKVRRLLEILRPRAYVPVDICREHVLKAASEISTSYPWLEVFATCSDFLRIADLPPSPAESRSIIFFPGSTIGNFEPTEAQRFLSELGRLAGRGGGLLIGVDLQKSTQRLNQAYNDAQGVTAEFNLNLLARLNSEMEADFDLNAFEHLAFYNERLGRVEMHLRSRRAQRIRLGDVIIPFEKGETIHTENSYKYTVEAFQSLARGAGLLPKRCWADHEQLFSVHYLTTASRCQIAARDPLT